VLLAAAGLMLRTMANLRAIDIGFRPDHVLTLRTTLPALKYKDLTQRSAFFQRVIDEVRVLPGVQSVGYGSTLPFTSAGNTRWFSIEGYTAQNEQTDTLFRVATPGYFLALGARALEGRLLEDRDANAEAPGVIINETMANRYWQGAS